MGHLGPTWYVGDVTAPDNVVYHYTSRQALKAILTSGVLKPHRTMPGDRLPILWCSRNSVWEPASGRGQLWDASQPIPFDVLAQRGLARIALDASVVPLDWARLRTLVSPQWLALLRGEAGSWVREHCRDWYGTTRPVRRDHWLAIERWQSPRWIEIPYSWEA